MGGNAGAWGKEPFNTTTAEGEEDFIALCNNIILTIGANRLSGIDLDLEWTSAFSWRDEDWNRLADAIIQVKKSHPEIEFRATVPTSSWTFRPGYRSMQTSKILQNQEVFDNINIMVMDASTSHVPGWYRSYLDTTVEYLGLENTRGKDIITPVFSWESNPTNDDFIEVARLYNADGYHKLALWQGNLDNTAIVEKIGLVSSGSPIPPTPASNYDLQISDTDTNLGVSVTINGQDGSSFNSDYINPRDAKVYNNNTVPSSSSIMEKQFESFMDYISRRTYRHVFGFF